MIKYIPDDEPNPPANTPGRKARILKIKPFTNSKRKRYHIDDKFCQHYGEISDTQNEQVQNIAPEFKEYYRQNYKNQFYFKQREVNMELKNHFLQEVHHILEDVDVDNSQDLTREECNDFFNELSRKLYGKESTEVDYKDFWKKQNIEKKFIEYGKISE